MRYVWTRYLPSYLFVILYMLQASEYHAGEYIKWLRRTADFRTVMRRKRLVWTNKVKLLFLFLVVLITLAIVCAYVFPPTGLIFILLLPWIVAYGIVIPLWLGEVLIQKPKQRRMFAAARQKLTDHPATKIAIVGSFGKTTAKEILLTLLSEGEKVAATPGNMNTMIGNSQFIQSLDGDEKILIFELGESHVGDIRELCELIQPDMGIIAGINEAHLATFGSIDNTIKTIFELKDFLGDKPIYKNVESALVKEHSDPDDLFAYSQNGVDGWRVGDKETSVDGIAFTIRRKNETIHGNVKLLGVHNVGILSAAISIANRLGLSVSQINAGLKKITPFEHRMQPYQLHGAWIIDDTYNGNIEGVQAGLKLLKSLQTKRRVYVTPGLVEQGDKTAEIHEKIGALIADAADVAVLMKNSVTTYITNGLESAGFHGKLLIIDEPLDFYANLDHFVAAGDIVLMQNDWTDNYE